MAYKRPRAAFEADVTKQESPYVFYGAPLPPLDPDARDDGSYVPEWQQEVRDERGRKRFHGAFTGGFSAGYGTAAPTGSQRTDYAYTDEPDTSTPSAPRRDSMANPSSPRATSGRQSSPSSSESRISWTKRTWPTSKNHAS